ncbi:large ribosomal subunit protein eL20z-like [Humulus lupulus]|uniref:large ribosomal subunit protein eL20z-like n=1 Tax=Humulus lupulus TaxID=3486 RepID=UPI002B4094A2|nr:large ribosomal subunit protein eL20z-like [Humulus lupulus]
MKLLASQWHQLVPTMSNLSACFGCGIGWFSFLLGFVFPPLWYYATVLYFGNYYLKDPRERPGLAASAIAALICSVIVLVSLAAVLC